MNYRTADDAQAKTVVEDWGSLNWLASKDLTGSEDLTLGRVVIKRGMSNPKHMHPDSIEVLYLLKGRLQHVIGGETVRMEPGDTTIVPPGVLHVAYSVGEEDADMIVAYPTGQRKFVLEE